MVLGPSVASITIPLVSFAGCQRSRFELHKNFLDAAHELGRLNCLGNVGRRKEETDDIGEHRSGLLDIAFKRDIFNWLGSVSQVTQVRTVHAR